MNILTTVLLASVLIPTKGWYAPNQPVSLRVQAAAPVTLMLSDFSGQNIDPVAPARIEGEKSIDLRTLFPLNNPGTYILYAVPQGASTREAQDRAEFAGTPLVIDVRADRRPGSPSGPMVVRVRPLVYAVMETDAGPMTVVFFFDTAPHTAENFLALSREGFYDGLTFHRIVPGFIVQGGDPRGDGTGGPGYLLGAEFNDRPSEEGVISMARQADPNEPASMPRFEFANSGGSQFFISLDYSRTRPLDGRYAAFAKVVDGLKTLRAIGQSPIADSESGRPQKPPVIRKVEIRPVTAKDNPYRKLMDISTTRPATMP